MNNERVHPTTDRHGNPRPSITKREYFAAMAMQGLLASFGRHDVTEYDELAHDAVMASDALLSELERTHD